MHCFCFFLAIPALQPIVHDLFVLRGSNKADAGKELETQKEVVVSMLLRLIQHHQVALLDCLHCCDALSCVVIVTIVCVCRY